MVNPASNTPASPGPRWLQRNSKQVLALAVGTLLVALLAGTEYILEHIERPPPPARNIRLREHRPLLHRVIVPARRLVDSPEVDGFEQKTYILRTDADGFIMPSRVHDDPDLTLLFLGGSTTECLYVDEENRFPYRAGALLGERLHKRINAYNSGVSGNNSLHSLDILLNKGFPLRPDIVVFLHNINDLNIMLWAGSYWNQNRHKSPIVVEHSSQIGRLSSLAGTLFPALAARAARAAGRIRREPVVDEFEEEQAQRRRDDKERSFDTSAMIKDFRGNLLTFVAMSRARGILPVLMTEFNRFKENPDGAVRRTYQLLEKRWGIDSNTYTAHYRLFNDSIRKVAKQEDVLLVDLDALVPKERAYMYDIVHLNNEGATFVATTVADALADSMEVQLLLRSKKH